MKQMKQIMGCKTNWSEREIRKLNESCDVTCKLFVFMFTTQYNTLPLWNWRERKPSSLDGILIYNIKVFFFKFYNHIWSYNLLDRNSLQSGKYEINVTAFAL